MQVKPWMRQYQENISRQYLEREAVSGAAKPQTVGIIEFKTPESAAAFVSDINVRNTELSFDVKKAAVGENTLVRINAKQGNTSKFMLENRLGLEFSHRALGAAVGA